MTKSSYAFPLGANKLRRTNNRQEYSSFFVALSMSFARKIASDVPHTVPIPPCSRQICLLSQKLPSELGKIRPCRQNCGIPTMAWVDFRRAPIHNNMNSCACVQSHVVLDYTKATVTIVYVCNNSICTILPGSIFDCIVQLLGICQGT